MDRDRRDLAEAIEMLAHALKLLKKHLDTERNEVMTLIDDALSNLDRTVTRIFTDTEDEDASIRHQKDD